MVRDEDEAVWPTGYAPAFQMSALCRCQRFSVERDISKLPTERVCTFLYSRPASRQQENSSRPRVTDVDWRDQGVGVVLVCDRTKLIALKALAPQASGTASEGDRSGG